MLIPIDRPLIDARNIRDAATQTVSAGFVATHNQRRTLILTSDSADRASGAPHIQAGAKPGQLLTIIFTDDAKLVTITDGGGAGTQLSGDWVVGDGYGIGSRLNLLWDGTRWWEIGRGPGELTMSGLGAHAEGRQCTASNNATHAEGRDTTSSGNYSHSEGFDTIASNTTAHAEGRACTASGYVSHASGYDALANMYGQYAHAGKKFSAQGDAQFSRFVGHKLITMSNSWRDILFLDGVDDLLIIPNNFMFAFEALVVGLDDVSAGGVNKSAYKISGAIWNNDIGNIALLNHTVTVIHEDDASYDCQCTADNITKNLEIQVIDTENDGASVRWVATVWGTWVSFP